MIQEDGIARRTEADIRTEEGQKARYEGYRVPTQEEVEVLQKARDSVIAYYEKIGISTAAERVHAWKPDDARVYDRKFVLRGSVWTEDTQPGERAFVSGRIEFPAKTTHSQDFLHVAVHELFHQAAGRAEKLVNTSSGSYIRVTSGIVMYPIGRTDGALARSELRFLGLSEAITDTNTRLALPEDATQTELPRYKMYSLVLHALLRRIVQERKQADSSYGLREAWGIFQTDYTSGTHTFLSELKGVFGPDTYKRLANFGNDRDKDLRFLLEICPSEWGFANESDVADMLMDTGDTAVSRLLTSLDNELRDAIGGGSL